MKKLQKIAIFAAFALILSGCGMKVVTPEATPETDTNGTGTGTAMERTCEISEYDRCVTQFQLAQKDVAAAQKSIKQCEDNLEAYQKKLKDNQANIERLNEIFKNYTETTEQPEFKFDLCGKMGNFEKQSWYTKFQDNLITNPIAFTKAGRSVRVDDLTGGCSSSEGNMAFFMGAETADMNDTTGSGTDLFEPSDLFEFHLMKYDIAQDKIEEVLMADGICNDETCPAVFLSREGTYIPMSGVSKTENCNYKYYFAKNILVKTDCSAK